MGETQPYLLWRPDALAKAFSGDGKTLKPAEIIRCKVALTTAGKFSDSRFSALRGNSKRTL
jgi:hypothetical protein